MKLKSTRKRQLRAIRSDRGGEYISQEFKDYLKARNCFQRRTAYTPSYTGTHNKNVVSERKISLLHAFSISSTKKVDKTPYELWHGKVPNLSYLKVWGCEAHVKCHMPDKLQQRSVNEHPIEEESLAPIVSQEEDGVPVRRSCFSMKDFREAAFILGIKIYRVRSRRLIRLSQNAYLDKILKRYRMENSKRGSIPMQVDLHLNKPQCATTSAEMKRMQNVPYASLRSIMYAVEASHKTRCGVREAKHHKLRFGYGGNPEAELQVKCYCDDGFETDRDDTKSQTGTTAQHATEAEYIAASEAAKEAVWIRKFIDELGVVPSNDYPIKMNCDNSATIIIAPKIRIQKGARTLSKNYHLYNMAFRPYQLVQNQVLYSSPGKFRTSTRVCLPVNNDQSVPLMAPQDISPTYKDVLATQVNGPMKKRKERPKRIEFGQVAAEQLNEPNQKKRKVQKKIKCGPIVKNEVTEQLESCIRETIKGSDIKLVIQKLLYMSDLNKSQNRLNMPINQLETKDFLTNEEKTDLKSGKEIVVPLLGPTLRMYAEPMKLKIRPMGRTNNYVLMNKWNNFVEENKDYLKQLSTIQLWSFRVDQQLCFALAVVESPMANGVNEVA
ncbi:retrotransposon protein, putative, ty1-copia subclass [Tanacetum coccineum]